MRTNLIHARSHVEHIQEVTERMRKRLAVSTLPAETRQELSNKIDEYARLEEESIQLRTNMRKGRSEQAEQVLTQLRALTVCELHADGFGCNVI
jgi:hypothetical protein